MLSDFDITMSGSMTALLLSMGQFAQASFVLGLSLFFLIPEED